MRGTTETILSSESIDQFLKWCSGRGRAENTVRGYGADLRILLAAIGPTPVGELEELAMSWLNLNRRKVSPKTTARRLASVRGFAKWAGVADPLEDYIAPVVARPIAHPIPEGIDGIRSMLLHARSDEQEALIALGGLVGLRITEVISVTTEDFNLTDMLLTIRGKGDKTRIVPISPEAWSHISSAFIKAIGRDDQRLVTYQDRFARQVVTNLAKKADLRRHVTSHDLRATLATEMLNNGANIRVVQEILGHASVETTEIYTGVAVNQMREAVKL